MVYLSFVLMGLDGIGSDAITWLDGMVPVGGIIRDGIASLLPPH